MGATFHFYGIRHHGPGSARALCASLAEKVPDVLVVEGPPEASELIDCVVREDVQPPLAMLFHDAKEPSKASFYPLASFSPEWQALRFALAREIPVRFMDLPAGAMHVLDDEKDSAASSNERGREVDPLDWIARACGEWDGEVFWERLVEERAGVDGLFPATSELMSAVRTEHERERPLERREALREAWMRQALRAVEREGFEVVAVVCGAWHVPALANMPTVKHDRELLKGLPKKNVSATWVPWTFANLAIASGYRAGVRAPGWYEHLFTCGPHAAPRWLSRVSRLLRDKGLDVSAAQVIDAARLSETLATFRGRHVTSLAEMEQAVQTVYLQGETLPLVWVHDELLIGSRMGSLPDDLVSAPLAKDLRALVKRLRLKMTAAPTELVFDLRKPLDRERSETFRRLALLGIDWARGGERAPGKGTFKERWTTLWKPEMEVALIAKSALGSTIAQAASRAVQERARATVNVVELADLARDALLCQLEEALRHVLEQLDARAALTHDVPALLGSVAPLSVALRYGDVRGTDLEAIFAILKALVVRSSVGLSQACTGLDDEATRSLDPVLRDANEAIALLDREELTAPWTDALERLSTLDAVHPLLRGRVVRWLAEGGCLARDAWLLTFRRAVSRGQEATHVAAWLEGFLEGRAELLLHDDETFLGLDAWIGELTAEAFQRVLPLVRRTFATFERAALRRLAQRVQEPSGGHALQDASALSFDEASADAVLPRFARFLGCEVADHG